MTTNNLFSRKVSVFHDRVAPEEGYLAGYALLMDILADEGIQTPLPDRLTIISEKHHRYANDEWLVLTPRHRPDNNLKSHLFFALRYEGVDLYILKNIFRHSGPESISQIIRHEPTSQYARRLWFLYEWLLGPLDLPDLKTGTYVEVLDEKLQYPGPVRNSTRHRVKNNLPGSSEFCPLIRRTETIEQYIAMKLNERGVEGIHIMDRDLLRRAAAFLLLKDSKASFAIEGEYPPDIRAHTWGKIIGEAGKHPLSIKEIERLQNIVIGSKKLKQMGLRTGEGFIGDHDSVTFDPIPEHISAKANDLPSLMKGLIDTEGLLRVSAYDPILAAATIAFGFVFIHPLLDGNGRIHRYLIHHILASMKYTRRDMIFPVSAAMLDKLPEYRDALQAYSNPRLELIQWEGTDDHNVKITNETIDIYRYYDLTRQAEYLYRCVEETIKHTIPDELDYLHRYDQVVSEINEHVSLPNNKIDLLIKMLQQNVGKLSKAKREKFFDELSDEEFSTIEEIFSHHF